MEFLQHLTYRTAVLWILSISLCLTSLCVQSSVLPGDLLHRTRRQAVPTRRDIDVVVEWLKRNLPTMGMELCNDEDAYEGIRCPGTDQQDDQCASWDEVCDGVQKCGLRKREICINALITEENMLRAAAEDRCSGEESSNACDIKAKEPPRCGFDYQLTEDDPFIQISSPRYPDSYPGDMHCFWRVAAPPDSKITVEFLDFGTEANYDYVNLGKGHKCDPVNRMNYAIYKHSGSFLPDPATFTVDASEVFASFYSDTHDHGKGFSVRLSLAKIGSADILDVEPPEYNRTCGGVVDLLANSETVITSPNYPNKYDNLFQCDWIITVPKGRRLGFRFKDFRTEKSADILEIGDGRNAGSNVLYSLSGHKTPEDPLVVDHSKAWVRFTTDDSNRRVGFKLQIMDYPINDCGGVYEVPRGGSIAVASPLYPFRAYRLNQECLWVFTTGNGRKLSVNFADFSLAYDDILSTGSGTYPAYDWSNYIIKEARGDELPRPKRYFSGKNSVWFYFKSDDAHIARGFKAEVFDSDLYKPKKKPKKGKRQMPNMDCGGVITREDVVDRIEIRSPGYSYEPLVECLWLIDVPFGGDVRIRFEYLNLERFLDTLTIGNGTNPNKKKTEVMTYSGFDKPPTYEATFHQMWIRFNSDLKHEFGGFSLIIEPRPYTLCGGVIQVPRDGSVALASPNYPDLYPPNLLCRYVIKAPLHHRLTVSLAGFETEVGTDTLTVSEGCPATDPDGNNVVYYEYSGMGLPVNYQILPRSDSIWVEFRTDALTSYHGFLLNFADAPLKAVSTEGVGCPVHNRTDPEAYVAGSLNGLHEHAA